MVRMLTYILYISFLSYCLCLLDLRTRLSSLTPESSATSQAYTEITNDLVSLRKEVNDAIAFLPAYDRGLYERV